LSKHSFAVSYKLKTEKILFESFYVLMLKHLMFYLESEDPVPVDGGRYDVDLKSLKKVAVYWEEAACDVKRCSWFYKGPLDSRFVPYDDDVCLRLEVSPTRLSLSTVNGSVRILIKLPCTFCQFDFTERIC